MLTQFTVHGRTYELLSTAKPDEGAVASIFGDELTRRGEECEADMGPEELIHIYAYRGDLPKEMADDWIVLVFPKCFHSKCVDNRAAYLQHAGNDWDLYWRTVGLPWHVGVCRFVHRVR